MLKKLEFRTETETFFSVSKKKCTKLLYKRLQVELKIYKGDAILRIFRNNNHIVC